MDAATAEVRAAKILAGLGFTKEMQEKKTRALLGGGACASRSPGRCSCSPLCSCWTSPPTIWVRLGLLISVYLWLSSFQSGKDPSVSLTLLLLDEPTNHLGKATADHLCLWLWQVLSGLQSGIAFLLPSGSAPMCRGSTSSAPFVVRTVPLGPVFRLSHSCPVL